MSTMYYTFSGDSIGQIHSLGRNKGYHFTWCMFPLEYARIRKDSALIKNNDGDVLSMRAFEDIVDASFSQSFDEEIE